MNMWLILMIVLAVLSFAGILYLANRIGKFAFIRKITKGKKGFSTLTGLLIAVVYTAVIWMAWGSMNAIVCILHLIVFWMVSEAIFALITKIRKRHLQKVAVFSDSHTGTTFHGEGFAEHMKTIEAQNPDVVLIVGDFVDDDTTKEDRTSLRIMQEAVRRWKN